MRKLSYAGFLGVFIPAFVINAQGTNPTNANSASASPSQYAEQASAQAQGTQTIQTSPYNSFYQSSVDTMKNSQMGQATAAIISNSLETEASAQSGLCDPLTPDGAAACATAGVLVDMASEAHSSSLTFEGPIQNAWQNVCEFSSVGCGSVAPNPFTPIMNANPGLTPQQVGGVTQVLANHGYIVNTTTGIISVRNGVQIHSRSEAGIRKAIGLEKTQALMNRIQSFEKTALLQVQKIKKAAYHKSVGLDGSGYLSAAQGAGPSDSSGQKLLKNSSQERQTRRPASAGVYFKLYNGEPIGIATESIFKIVTKRYQFKIQEKSLFLPSSSSGD